MLNVIVPPATLASVIALRNEPVPLSLVFVTVKTNGTVVLCNCGDSCASGTLEFVTRVERADCAVSSAERPNPPRAKEMPVRTIARPKKTCEPKKADCETGFFLMRRLLTRPGARSP